MVTRTMLIIAVSEMMEIYTPCIYHSQKIRTRARRPTVPLPARLHHPIAEQEKEGRGLVEAHGRSDGPCCRRPKRDHAAGVGGCALPGLIPAGNHGGHGSAGKHGRCWGRRSDPRTLRDTTRVGGRRLALVVRARLATDGRGTQPRLRTEDDTTKRHVRSVRKGTAVS